MNMACDDIIKRLNKIKEKATNQQLKLNKKTTAMANAVDIILQGEDYTIGKIIEYVLYSEYYLNSKILITKY